MRISVNPFSKIRNRFKAGQLKPVALDLPVGDKQLPLDICLRDSALYQNGKEALVLYCREQKKSLYRVRLWLDGQDLPQVAEVRYRFPTASGLPDVPMTRQMNNARCETFIWACGLLELAVELVLKDGRTYQLSHELGFGEELKRARTTFIEVAATGTVVA